MVGGSFRPGASCLHQRPRVVPLCQHRAIAEGRAPVGLPCGLHSFLQTFLSFAEAQFSGLSFEKVDKSMGSHCDRNHATGPMAALHSTQALKMAKTRLGLKGRRAPVMCK